MTVFLHEFLKLISYFVISASLALLSRLFTKLPDEVFRKLLHLILIGSAPVFLFVFSSWQGASLATLVFAILVYPLLSLAEGLGGYSELFVERDRGEIKKSLLYVFAMFFIVISISWGLIGEKYLALAVILGWGLGDAAAALVGKKYGRTRLESRFLDGKKTLEGSLAMFAVSFITILMILLVHTDLSWQAYLFIPLITSLVNALTELYTKNGLDTITCPAAILLILLPLLYLMG